MSEGDTARAFEPFYRADPSRPFGTGLGLSIVGKLCARFGWRVELESELGEGTRATVFFA
jgi:signal transduction histidine kinase